ncbi:MAG: phosphotransferase family protein [Candidatus Acidiferrales bacterium]
MKIIESPGQIRPLMESRSAVDIGVVQARLAATLGAAVKEIRVLASGWETTVFEFALATPSIRTRELPVNRPLVLRFYEGAQASEKAEREYPAMCALARQRFPVPRPYLLEPLRDALGAPFVVMERVAGSPLFSTKSFPRAFKTFSLGFISFVRAQTRLHQIDPARLNHDGAFANPQASLLERMLGLIGQRVEQGPLPGLAEALARLRERATLFATAPAALVHLDYHPQNVIVNGLRVTGVIDWVNADRGDRHLDAATTAVILASSAMDRPRWMNDNVAGNSLRKLFASLYIPMYHALAPLELRRFRYCQAVTALLRLSTFGMMRTRGPEAIGYRPEAIVHVTPAVVRLLSRYTARKTGVPVHI